MKIVKLVLLLSTTIFPSLLFGTTWDEPWQDKVIREADYFVFAKIRSSNEKSVTIEIIKSLGGPVIKGTIKITNFHLLDLCSRSGGHGPEFSFDGVKESFLFLKKNKAGEYCIATPTAGFAHVKDEMVSASYRHSYHQAYVPVDIYEKTMTAIFNHYHDLPYDTKFINDYVKKYLSSKPAGFSEEEISTFFAQHVALESIYHLKLTGFYSEVLPFVNDTANFHNQVSGARALVSSNTTECQQVLMGVIGDSTREKFVQVICIWTLDEFKPKELKQELIGVEKTASEEREGFGGNIMDPRVCTVFPSVKEALGELILKL
jgi:hypothetical protein